MGMRHAAARNGVSITRLAIAGAIVSIADRDQAMTHPDFRRKLEAIGFGFFIPVFFVSSGVRSGASGGVIGVLGSGGIRIDPWQT